MRREVVTAVPPHVVPSWGAAVCVVLLQLLRVVVGGGLPRVVLAILFTRAAGGRVLYRGAS